jgi:hypothetical protein
MPFGFKSFDHPAPIQLTKEKHAIYHRKTFLE